MFFLLVSFSVFIFHIYFIFIACENGSVLAMKRFCTDTSNEQNRTSCAHVLWGFLMAETQSAPAVGCRCAVDGVTS